VIVGSNNRDKQGRRRGADAHAKSWAERCGIDTTVMDANWIGHGLGGGPRRNARMLKYLEMLCYEHAAHPGLVIALPGGDGTDDLVTQATGREGVEVLVYPELPPELRPAA
jgi:hypothetical protein